MEVTAFYLMLFLLIFVFCIASWAVVYGFAAIIKHMVKTGEWDKPILPRKKRSVAVVDPNYIRKDLYVEVLVKRAYWYLRRQWYENHYIYVIKCRIINLWYILRMLVAFVFEYLGERYEYVMSIPTIQKIVHGVWTGKRKILPHISKLADYVHKNLTYGPNKK